MRAVKVCVYDEEERYARQLSAFLNRKGKGRMNVTAITGIDNLRAYMGTRKTDILLAADRELLCEMKRWKENLYILWLREEEHVTLNREMPIVASISRYAGAERIFRVVEKAASPLFKEAGQGIPLVAVYSPVGRCGKTQFALEIAGNPVSRWIYIGMEDYGCVWNPEREGILTEKGDAFLYFVKERDKEQLYQVIEECDGIVPSVFSPFDSKTLDGTDWEWLMEAMREYTGYRGVLFDVGTGILQELLWLFSFDFIIVPYLQEKQALEKKKKFETFVEAYGLSEMVEKFWFVDMGNEEEIRKRKKELEYQ